MPARLIRERCSISCASGGLSVAALDRALNEESGLKALSGRSGDVRELEAAATEGDEAAQLALAVYSHRIAGAVSGMAASLGGLDALVFTAGVGERSATVRERVCARLRFLGVELDQAANEAAETEGDIAAPVSAVRVVVVHAREDLVIARAVRPLLAERRTRAGRASQDLTSAGPV